ncbi:MAG: ABC transporter substrate-binding protein [Balneolaceae bacterium]|nr:MAG: ABC transporter substrate-binding protein [Balneolaceae bacterium]
MLRSVSLYRVVLAVALFTVAMVAACGPVSRDTVSDRVQIKYWYVSGATEQVPLSVTLFNASQDSIEVIPVAIPWKEHEKKVLTAILSGDPPDIINLVTPIVKWASRMALQPLDEKIAGSDRGEEDFYPANWDDVTWMGSVFGLPMHTASYAFFFNKDHFRQAGLDPDMPPDTWDDVLNMARKLDTRDAMNRITRMGFLPDYGNLQTPILMAWQQDMDFLKGDTLVNLNDKALIAAMDWMESFYEPFTLHELLGFQAGLGLADQHGFISGRISMMVLDNTFLDQIGRYNPGIDYGVAAIPTWPGYPEVSSTGTWWVAIPRGAANPEEAWAFMEFATSAETQIYEALNMKENLFPANRAALTDSTFLMVHPTHEMFTRMLAVARSPSVVPMAHDLFWREYGAARESIKYGRRTPGQALMQAERRIQRELNDAIEYDRFVRSRMDFGGMP